MRKNERYNELIADEKKEQKTSRYDFSSFIQVKSSSRKAVEEILGVLTNGELTMNARLLSHFPEHKMNILIRPDCSEIALFLQGG